MSDAWREAVERHAGASYTQHDPHVADIDIFRFDEDGAIVLRQAGVYPFEPYDDVRIAEFLELEEEEDTYRPEGVCWRRKLPRAQFVSLRRAADPRRAGPTLGRDRP